MATTPKKESTDYGPPILFASGIVISIIWAVAHRAPKTSELHGTVTDAVTGAPIEGAQLSIGGYSATSASDGTYRITGMVPGNYSGMCAAAGYLSEEIGMVLPGGNFAFDITMQAG